MTYDYDHDAVKAPRGRTCTRLSETRLPSRTPSPSGCSVCISEASTNVASWMNKEDSLSDVSTPDLNDCIEDSREVDRLPVKNTFVHFLRHDAEDFEEDTKKLSRCSSAPGALLSCPFVIHEPPTVEELHYRGECSPCAYFTSKADGCRRGADCGFCHLCPADELKARKKMRLKAIKEAKKEKAALEALEAASAELC